MQVNIMLASLLALVAYAWSGSKKSIQEQEALLKEQRELIVMSNTAISWETEVMLKNFQSLLEDDTKVKYRYLLVMIEQATDRFDVVRKKIAQLQKVGKAHPDPEEARKSLEKLVMETSIAVEASLEMGLRLNGNNLDLRPEEVQERMHSLDFPGDREKVRRLFALELDEPYGYLKFMEQLNHVNTLRENRVVTSLASLSGGRAFYCDFGPPFFLYPLITPTKNGDTFEFLLVADWNKDPNAGNYIQLKINGRKVQPDYNGVFRYQGKYQTGEPVTIHYSVMNPLTGETYTGEVKGDPLLLSYH